MMRKGFYAGMLALALGVTTVFSGVTPLAASAQTATVQEDTSGGYVYCYAGLTWNEYWASEGVYAAGNAASSTEVDSKGESDLGAFDAVTRATKNHGLHRGNYQCSVVVYDTEGNKYNLSYWDGQSDIYLTDGTKIGLSKGVITLTDGTTKTMDYYEVLGLKYVPVAVETEDYDDFKKAYNVVENDGKLAGGYSENNLSAYSVTANVTANTNGLKTATKNEDGTFTFSARNNGTDSGLKDTALKTASGLTAEVKTTENVGSYGEFLRVDFTGDYGDLGAKMQAVKWTYYGDDSTYTKEIGTYGTKFAADNWMHKSMGIQLGLTESLRCQLPEGYDGTGYWKVTIYALGYEDYSYTFQATAENLPKDETVDTTELSKLTETIKALNKADYTEESWNASGIETELQEAEEMLATTPANQAMVREQIKHLQAAIDALVKAENTTKEQKKDTSSTTELKDSGITLAKPVLKGKKAVKTTNKSAKIKWKKVANATGYEIQYTNKKSFKKASAIKTVTVKAKTSAKLKKLKKSSKYKVRVRAVYEADGYKTVYSAWSKVKTVKTK